MGSGGLIGTALGGAAGFALGGPAGAMMGASLGGSVGGGMDQAQLAQEGTQAQLASQGQSLALQKEMFDKQLELNKPWQEAGLEALKEYADNPKFEFNYDSFTADPSYQFRVKQGVNALDMSAASRGKLLSGAQDKAITGYGQGMASEEYANAYNRALQNYNTEQNRQLNIANIGRGAAGQTQQAMQNYTAGAGNAYSAMGNAAAQGAANQGNAYAGISQSVNQGLGNALVYNMYNKQSLPSLGIGGNFTSL